MAKKWSQAGQAFCEAAALHLKAAGRHDAATNYIDAGNCYKKSEPNGKMLYIGEQIVIGVMGTNNIYMVKYRGCCMLLKSY